MKNKLNFWILVGSMAFTLQAYAKPESSVRNFSLIDTDTGEVIEGYQNIQNGTDIDLDQLPTDALSIRANTQGKSKSALFELDGSYSFLSNAKPYYLCGTSTSGGEKVVTPCPQLSLGSHTLTATSFSEKNGKGEAGESLTISFEIFSSNVPDPTPTVTPNPFE